MSTEERTFVFPEVTKVSSVIDHSRPIVKVVDEDMEKARPSVLHFFICYLLAFWVLSKKIIFGKKIKTNTLFFDGLSSVCREIKENAFSWVALEIVYNLPRYGDKNSIPDKVANYWNGLANARVVRNRFRLAKKILREEILKRYQQNKRVRILSVASGSARAVAETISELIQQKILPPSAVSSTLLDLDPSAIEYAKSLAEELKISNVFSYVNDSTSNIESHFKENDFDIVEMVGFLEYRPNNKAVNLLKKLRALIKPSGVIIVSQIAPNPERMFLAYVMNWPMIYRKRACFRKLLQQSGLRPDDAYPSIIYEAQRIHGIVICKNDFLARTC